MSEDDDDEYRLC